MATLTICLGDKLKNDACAELEKLGITPSEAVRLTFQYIFENNQLPVGNIVISEHETDLIATVQERLKNPQEEKLIILESLLEKGKI